MNLSSTQPVATPTPASVQNPQNSALAPAKQTPIALPASVEPIQSVLAATAVLPVLLVVAAIAIVRKPNAVHVPVV